MFSVMGVSCIMLMLEMASVTPFTSRHLPLDEIVPCLDTFLRFCASIIVCTHYIAGKFGEFFFICELADFFFFYHQVGRNACIPMTLSIQITKLKFCQE